MKMNELLQKSRAMLEKALWGKMGREIGAASKKNKIRQPNVADTNKHIPPPQIKYEYIYLH